MAVDVLAGEGDEEAARLGLPAVEHGRRGHRHGPSPATVPPTTAAISPRLSGIMPPVKAVRRIAGISKTRYAPATARCLDLSA